MGRNPGEYGQQPAKKNPGIFKELGVHFGCISGVLLYVCAPNILGPTFRNIEMISKHMPQNGWV
jgi:hypothetical protein